MIRHVTTGLCYCMSCFLVCVNFPECCEIHFCSNLNRLVRFEAQKWHNRLKNQICQTIKERFNKIMKKRWRGEIGTEQAGLARAGWVPLRNWNPGSVQNPCHRLHLCIRDTPLVSKSTVADMCLFSCAFLHIFGYLQYIGYITPTCISQRGDFINIYT